MKYSFIATIMSVLLIAGLPATAQEAQSDSDFIADFGDVPLMKGLTELEEERVIFDTEAGTIAETVLTGKLKANDILDFYSESLKQLGWRKLKAGSSSHRLSFSRDRQVLSLRLFDSNGTKSLLVHLEPGN